MTKLAILFCCLLLICSWPEASSSNKLQQSRDIIDFALSIYSGIDAGKTIKDYFDQNPSPITQGEDIAIGKIYALSQDIHALKEAILFKISDQLYTKLAANLKILFDLAADVEFAFKKYLNSFYIPIQRYERINVNDLIEFANTNTEHKTNLFTGLERTMFKMHEILIKGDSSVESTLFIIIKESSQVGLLCSRKESAQQLIKELYDLVINTHLKGLQIRQFCYFVREDQERISYQRAIDDDFGNFKKQVHSTYKAVKSAMEIASRNLYNCDPPIWEQGKNYEQLGPVLQTHIVLGTDLAGDHGRCDTKKGKHTYYSDESRLLEVSKRCEEGNMRNCEPFVQEFEACYSVRYSPRLYDWVKPHRNDIYGYKNFTNCSNKTLEISLNQFQKLAGVNHCLCTCDSGRRAEDRYFSLTAVESDIARNKVVTGAQIVKLGRIFRIKIQEGELGPFGTIIGNAVWKELPEGLQKYDWQTISEYASSTTKTKIPHTNNLKDDVQKYVYDTKFHKNAFLHTVTYDWNTVNLDEHTVRENEVVTGLSFNTRGNALVLEIQALPYDYTTGKLILDNKGDGRWTFKEFPDGRQEVVLSEPEVPTSSDARGELEISGNGKFVRFTTTDNRKDMGQNTVPFIDTQPIFTNPPTPLSGVGLILKRKGKSGGFLTLKLKHFDLSA